jgi:hypothetical protein
MPATASAPAVVLDVPHAINRPMDARHSAYLLVNADRGHSAVPVSGNLLRAVLRCALHAQGAAGLDPADDSVTFTFGPVGGMVPNRLGPVFRAVPCERPPLTPCCAKCGHWQGEHDEPGAPTACARYRLSIGPARYSVPLHEGITYAWTRRVGRTRMVFEVTEPTDAHPGGALVVNRFPASGDGPAVFAAHFRPIPAERRAELLELARARVARDRARRGVDRT